MVTMVREEKGIKHTIEMDSTVSDTDRVAQGMWLLSGADSVVDAVEEEVEPTVPVTERCSGITFRACLKALLKASEGFNVEIRAHSKTAGANMLERIGIMADRGIIPSRTKYQLKLVNQATITVYTIEYPRDDYIITDEV